MAESQVAQPATQQPATSASPQAQAQEQDQSRKTEPPRQVGSPKKPKQKDKGVSAQEAQRAEQMQKRVEVERKNPFSRDNKQARMAELLKTMRTERGVGEPQEKRAADGSPEQKRETAGGGDVHSGAVQPGGEPGDGVSRSGAVEGEKKAAGTPSNDGEAKPEHQHLPDWYKREQQAAQNEARARQAQVEADQKRAELEKLKADTDASLARMAAAKDDPVGFLSEQNITPDEWKQFLANGGKLTPEQRQLKQMADEMAKMRAQVEAADKRAQQQEAAARRAAEDAGFATDLNNFTYVPQMGGMAAVRARQNLLSQKTGQIVSLKDAATHLEDEMKQGLSRLLQNPKIRSSLNLDVNTSDARQAAEQPRTLNNAVTSQSSTADARVHPLDWKEKKRLYLQRVAQETAARTGR